MLSDPNSILRCHTVLGQLNVCIFDNCSVSLYINCVQKVDLVIQYQPDIHRFIWSGEKKSIFINLRLCLKIHEKISLLGILLLGYITSRGARRPTTIHPWLPSGDTVYVLPIPSPPTPWSRPATESRSAWLLPEDFLCVFCICMYVCSVHRVVPGHCSTGWWSRAMGSQCEVCDKLSSTKF